jgi:integral membrane protein (TIGR01906 family)
MSRADKQPGRSLDSARPSSYDGLAGLARAQEGCLGLVRQLAALLFIVALPVALVTTNIRIVTNEPRVYQYAIDHFHTTETTGIPRAELLRASAELRDYFNNNDDTIFVRVTTKDGQPVSLFNNRETAHLRDVKTLFQGSFRVQEVSVVFVLAYVVAVFIWAREHSLHTLAREILVAAALSAAAIGVLGVIALAGFDTAFERFHVIFFNNDLWQLDPARDHLIQMFPDGFWRDVTLWIGAGTLVELGVLAAAAGAYLGLTRRSPVAYAVPDGVQA